MKYLLDTHAFLWIIDDSKHLTEKVKSIYLDNSNDIFLSVASVWEIAIKVSLGKLTIKGKLNRFIDKQTSDNNILLLNITLHHVIPIEKLPFHNRDPFDRLLISQCIQEKMKIISRDTQFDNYRVQRVW